MVSTTLMILAASAQSARSQTVEFGLPVVCEMGSECFVQQGPDIDPGPGVRDPKCGAATYDGHDGWDIRVRWMPEIGVPVVAARDGVITRLRDGVRDNIVRTEADRVAIGGLECGNGIVIAHGDGWESQYCHLKNGSVSVRRGDRVAAGDRIAEIGASGLAQFPHVHFSVRRHGEAIEPLSGRRLGDESAVCGDVRDTLMEISARQTLAVSPAAILAAGISAEVPDSVRLMLEGRPPVLVAGEAPVIAWAWLINIEQGWRLRLRLADAADKEIVLYESEPLDHRKATYLAYAGRRSVTLHGDYRLEVQILDGKNVVLQKVENFSLN